MTRLCSLEGCTRIARARGWCTTHYTRWWKHGDPHIVLPRQRWHPGLRRQPMVRPECKFDGCERLSSKGGRGWCAMHHTRWYRHGDPSVDGNKLRKRRDVMERIRERVVEDDNGCWIWQGALYPRGYGAFGIGGRSTYSHRAAWQYVHGAVPDGHQLHHTCLNRACCNPDHLVALTVKEHRAAHRALTLEAA